MKAVSKRMRVKMAASEKNDGALSVLSVLSGERVERDRMKDEEGEERK